MRLVGVAVGLVAGALASALLLSLRRLMLAHLHTHARLVVNLISTVHALCGLQPRRSVQHQLLHLLAMVVVVAARLPVAVAEVVVVAAVGEALAVVLVLPLLRTALLHQAASRRHGRRACASSAAVPTIWQRIALRS